MSRRVSAHPRVQKVTNLIEVLETFNRHLRVGAPAGGLDLHLGQTQPSLHDVAGEMNVLDARISQADLAPEKDAPLHPDSFLVKAIPQGVIPEIEWDQRDEEERSEDQGQDDVVGPETGIRLSLIHHVQRNVA